jgi:hypothetical protein
MDGGPMSTPVPTVAQVLLPYTCTSCGKQKAEVNHWFVIWSALHELTDRDDVDAVMFAPWILAIAARPWAAVACGESCLHILISRHISTGLFTAPRSSAADPSPAIENRSSTIDPSAKEPSC